MHAPVVAAQLLLQVSSYKCLFRDAITGLVLFTRQLHSVLLYKSGQQSIYRVHNAGIAADFEVAMLLYRLDALCFYIAGNYTRKNTAQIGSKCMGFLVFV